MSRISGVPSSESQAGPSAARRSAVGSPLPINEFGASPARGNQNSGPPQPIAAATSEHSHLRRKANSKLTQSLGYQHNSKSTEHRNELVDAMEAVDDAEQRKKDFGHTLPLDEVTRLDMSIGKNLEKIEHFSKLMGSKSLGEGARTAGVLAAGAAAVVASHGVAAVLAPGYIVSRGKSWDREEKTAKIAKDYLERRRSRPAESRDNAPPPPYSGPTG